LLPPSIFWSDFIKGRLHEAQLADLNLGYSEDNWITVSWQDGRRVESVSLGFGSKSKVQPELSKTLSA
jgi:hypothetical protein